MLRTVALPVCLFLFSALMLGCTANNVINKADLTQYTTLIIKAPQFKNTIATDMNEDETKSFESNKYKYSNIFTSVLHDEISREKIFTKIANESSNDDNPLTLDCDFTKFDAGSRLLRYFISLGAGATTVGVQCNLTDNKGLIKSDIKEENVWGPFRMSAHESYFNDFVHDLAGDYASFVIDFMKEPTEKSTN